MFKVSPSGTYTVLHSFTGTGGDGTHPQAGLIADSGGNLCGTTTNGGLVNGGLSGVGVVFKLTPGGTYTVLYTFCKSGFCTDGETPSSGLIADSSGNLYGTTSQGGASNNGVVYKLAGTGFVTTTPFSTFSAQLQLDVNTKPAKDALALETSFTLGMTAPAINPLTQAVTFQAGPYSATIPAGSFKQFGPLFTYVGTINGVNVEALITPTGTMRYAFAAAAEHPNLTGTTNPVPVTLTIGSDSGTKSVTAIIFH